MLILRGDTETVKFLMADLLKDEIIVHLCPRVSYKRTVLFHQSRRMDEVASIGVEIMLWFHHLITLHIRGIFRSNMCALCAEPNAELLVFVNSNDGLILFDAASENQRVESVNTVENEMGSGVLGGA